jgi:hypothetical protein
LGGEEEDEDEEEEEDDEDDEEEEVEVSGIEVWNGSVSFSGVMDKRKARKLSLSASRESELRRPSSFFKSFSWFFLTVSF